MEKSRKINEKNQIEIQSLYHEINELKRTKITSDEKWRKRFKKWGEEIEVLRNRNKELTKEVSTGRGCGPRISTGRNSKVDSVSQLTNSISQLQNILNLESLTTSFFNPKDDYKEQMIYLEQRLIKKETEIEILKSKLALKDTNKLSEVKERFRQSVLKVSEENRQEIRQLISRNNILKEKLLNQVHQQESIIYLKKKLIEKDKIVRIKNDTVEDLRSQVTLRELEIDQLRNAIVNFQRALEMKSIVEMRSGSIGKISIP